jgi:hypothetical protein
MEHLVRDNKIINNFKRIDNFQYIYIYIYIYSVCVFVSSNNNPSATVEIQIVLVDVIYSADQNAYVERFNQEVLELSSMSFFIVTIYQS